jgi:ADP-heptose:LPS heptosyltransferase
MDRLKKILLLFYLNLIDFWATKRHKNIEPKTLLLIRFDAIGDYILFRNYLPYFKKSQKYRDYRITLLGNVLWKDLALTFDRDHVDEFIWLDRGRFVKDFRYRFKTLRDISRKGYEVVIQLPFTKDYFYADAIVKAANARKKIGSKGDKNSWKLWRKIISDRYYTELIEASPKVLFEFYRNQEFAEKLLNIKIKSPLKLDLANFQCSKTVPTKYVILFPGTGQDFKRWHTEYFAQIADFISAKNGSYILIAGSNGDKFYADDIRKRVNRAKILDITGKTSLSELAKIVSGAELLVANETGAVHMAAAVNTKTVCISNGFSIGLFNPYPSEISQDIHYIYPSHITDNLSNLEYLSEKYRYYAGFSINDIPVERVKEVIDKIML